MPREKPVVKTLRFEQTVPLANPEMFTVAMMKGCVEPAMRSAMEVIAEQARENLREHQSKLTGTRKGWSQSYRKEREGEPDLIDAIVVEAKGHPSTMTVTGIVTVQNTVRERAAALEFGHTNANWGRYKAEAVPPYPFLRPAYHSRRRQAVRQFYKELQLCFSGRRARRRRRTLILVGLVVGGAVVYTRRRKRAGGGMLAAAIRPPVITGDIGRVLPTPVRPATYPYFIGA